ncbi:ABC transporter substrate-binding protein [Streptomyces litchfieldiae]|uniref:ABC transporter substrate-binding protein n=1 Tax=Streptomyces litchfieldiae TaxID=3075543 RepID=A0ABU2MXZ4_9ACTN|nr:ABC transporter substrate-binding protein [Streptomyces sp. DSM 44938]MDT0345683.1 ABC transporter substrate-binding protein [Streptomyces sp. DSM 44938]
MRKRGPWVALPLVAGLLAALLTGCGLIGDDGAGEGEPIVVGMTDEVLATDPASGYDPGSWLVFNNVFQSLLSFPPGSSEPQPEAAENCGFTDRVSQRFTCTLRDGLTFSNGNELTAQDVKFSFDRTLRIDDPDGPAVLLSSIDRIETPDDTTVTFHLDRPDATFPQKIASGAGSIVDHRSYPPDELRTDGEADGSGPYTLESYTADEAVFGVNSDYRGPAEVRNSGVTMRLFHGDQTGLRDAVQSGAVDVAYRGLAAEDLADLELSTISGEDGLQVVDGTSAEVQHMVFNMADPVAGDPGVRRAIAHLIDRGILVRDVYQRTAEPLYSIVPAGITGHNTAFYDAYGDVPQPARAEAALRESGITEPVELTLWVTPTRFGPDTEAAFEYIARQLNDSGLFDATVRSVPADEFAEGVENGDFGVYVRGWVPDYPDPDNFTAPFFGADNILANDYDSPRITEELIPRTARESDRARTVEDFGALQDIVAEELPLIPLWQGKQYAVAAEEISGLQWALDASTVFRFWEITKSPAE